MQPLKKEKIISKSRRSKGIARDITEEVENGMKIFKPPEPEYMVYGEYLFMVTQLIIILVFAFCTELGDGVHPSSRDTVDASGFSVNKDVVQKLYPVF